MRDGLGGLLIVFVPADQPLPETSPPVLGVIANQVQRDPQQPGIDAALAPETLAGLICPQKTLLGQDIRGVAIFGQYENDAVYPALMLPHDRVEPIRRYFDGFLGSAAICAQGV